MVTLRAALVLAVLLLGVAWCAQAEEPPAREAKAVGDLFPGAAESLLDEGRGKKKRGAATLLMLLLMMGGMMLPLKMGTLAMLAGKALIVAKLALALSAIVGLKKLLSSDDHQDSYQVVQVPPGHHSRRKRSFYDLPYRAHHPTCC